MNTDTLASIPASLKDRRQWICWKYETKPDGKITKPPVSPHTGRIASATDPKNWVSFDEAVAACKRFNLSGIGFSLSPDDNLSGGDLDHCWKDSILSSTAQQVLNLAETYAEISPSGEGIRLIWSGKVPEAIKHTPSGIEIYGTDRYLTITGQHIDGTPTEVKPAPQTLALLRSVVDATKVDTVPPPAKLDRGYADSFHGRVNSAALANLGAWFTEIFPTAKRSTKGWRVPSSDLGRALEEDISATPEGIKDFGVHDMGDPPPWRAFAY